MAGARRRTDDRGPAGRRHPAGDGEPWLDPRRTRRPTDGAGARRLRLAAILDRDGPACVWCSRSFDDRVAPTVEHVMARVEGGPTWPENLVAACRRCNGERGHASPVQHLDTVRGLGREPRAQVLLDALLRLEQRIVDDGGARRVRGPLRSELRKIGHRPRI